MPKLILPADDLRRILRKRRAWGADRWDEVWDGVYIMSPLADNEHQKIGLDLAIAITQAIGDDDRIQVFPGVNVSDRPQGWRKNYRCPDVAVFLPGNPAQDRKTHWLGGPDFAVEIVSRGDRSRKKFDFYANVGVRELLLVDRKPWGLELHRRVDELWDLVGRSDPAQSAALASTVLPLRFRLLPGDLRPRIEVIQADGTQTWLV